MATCATPATPSVIPAVPSVIPAQSLPSTRSGAGISLPYSVATLLRGGQARLALTQTSSAGDGTHE